MGEKMIAILVEELTARGLTARITAPGRLDPEWPVWTPGRGTS
jgi:hypothetical protein